MAGHTRRNQTKKIRKKISTWVKLADLHGMDVLKHPSTCADYTIEY